MFSREKHGVAPVRAVLFLILALAAAAPDYCLAENVPEADLEKLKKNTVSSLENLPANLEMLAKIYFRENKYNDFVIFIKESLPKISDKKQLAVAAYYISWARFEQLRYLEKNQLWQEYFDKGVAYRQEFSRNVETVSDSVLSDEALFLDALFLKWRFLKEDQDVREREALDSLLSSVERYAEKSNDFMGLKKIAAALSEAEEISSARYIYGLYVNSIAKSDKPAGEIKKTAEAALAGGESELAVILFDLYLNKLDRKNEAVFVRELSDIARAFSYKSKNFNAEYAEKIFGLLDESCSGECYGEELLYTRAKNLQYSGMLIPSAAEYRKLVERFPKTKYADEADFKNGVVELYVRGNVESAGEILGRLAKEGMNADYRLLALYHLGLIYQWQGDLKSAKNYYQQIAGFSKTEISADLEGQLSLRLSEVNGALPLEYNLRVFLDTAWKNNAPDKYTPLEIKIEPDFALMNKDVTFFASSFQAAFGCLVQKTAYLWSGQVCALEPDINSPKLNCAYKQPGTKVVNIVVINSSGVVISRSMVILDMG